MIRVVQAPEGGAVLHLDADGLDDLIHILHEARYGTRRKAVMKRGFDGKALNELKRIEDDAASILGGLATLALTGEGEHDVG